MQGSVLTIVDLPVKSIRPDPKNLRRVFDVEDIKALGRNMKRIGQLEPIRVFPNGDGTYDLYDGERRWRAALDAGIPTLRAIIEDRPDQESLLFKKLSRVLQTKGLSKPEEVRAIEETLEDLGIRNKPEEWDNNADRLGGDLAKIKERMRIANLSPSLREKFDTEELPYTVAQSVGRIPDFQKQEEVVGFILRNELSGRFVTTQFIPKVLQFPDRPLMAVYDLARHEEKWRYAKPTKKQDLEPTIADLFDDLMDSLIKTERVLEEMAAKGIIGDFAKSEFYSGRLVLGVERLIDVLQGFLQSYEKNFANRRATAAIAELPEPPEPYETSER